VTVDEGFEKPKPKLRAMSVAELRKVVKARDKFLGANKPMDEAIELISEEYVCMHDSARAFVAWLRGEDKGFEAERTKNLGIERRHYVFDPQTGEQREIDTQPGSIPPKQV
jgi:hypothetical protein